VSGENANPSATSRRAWSSRLAVPHVAAHQAVHRPGPLHVPFHRLGRHPLVGGVLVEERALHLPLPRRVRREREPLGDLAPGVELQQLVGELGDRLPRLLLLSLPSAAAQPMERGRRPVVAGEPLHPAELLDREVQRLVVRVGDPEHLDLPLAREGQTLEAFVPTDPVVEMDQVVARLDLGQVHRDAGARVPAAAAQSAAAGEDLVIGVHGEPGLARPEPCLERPHDEHGLLAHVGRQELLETLPLAQVVAQDHGDDAGRQIVPQHLGQPPDRPLDRLGLTSGEPHRRSSGVVFRSDHVEGQERDPRERLQRGFGGPGVKPQRLGRLDLLLPSDRLPVPAHDLFPRLLPRGDGPGRLVDYQKRVGVEVVGHRAEEGRLPVRFVTLHVSRRPLPGGKDLDPLERLDRALGREVEPPDRGDLVAHQLDPDGVLVAVREDVDDPAAGTERSHFRDHRLGLEPHRHEPLEELLPVEAIPHRDADQPVGERSRSEDLLDHRPGRGHPHPERPVEEPGQKLQPSPDDLPLGRPRLVGEDLPLGVVPDPTLAQQGLEVAQPGVPPLGRGSDDENRPREVPGERRRENRLARAGEVRRPMPVGSVPQAAAESSVRGRAAEPFVDGGDQHGTHSWRGTERSRANNLAALHGERTSPSLAPTRD